MAEIELEIPDLGRLLWLARHGVSKPVPAIVAEASAALVAAGRPCLSARRYFSIERGATPDAYELKAIAEALHQPSLAAWAAEILTAAGNGDAA